MRFKRQALHAARLALEHPLTGKTLEWEAPVPPDMAALLAALEADAKAATKDADGDAAAVSGDDVRCCSLSPDWPVAPRACAAVMTTASGGSESLRLGESLNLGVHVGDNPAAVLENRPRVRKEARLPSRAGVARQVHGTP